MASSSDTPQLDRLHILAVDDNPINREFLHAALARRVGQLDTAQDGPSAIEQAAANAPDVLLVDLHMPGMDGVECRRRILAAGSTDKPPPRAIALTADNRTDERRRLLAAGFDDFLCKPVDPATLLQTVCRVCAIPIPADIETDWVTEGGGDTPVVLDDARAMAVNNHRPEAVARMRALLSEELAATQNELATHLARGEPAAAQALLHRWRGGCGYAGAERLAHACRHLERHLGQYPAGGELLQLNRSLALTRAALAETVDAPKPAAASSRPPPLPSR